MALQGGLENQVVCQKFLVIIIPLSKSPLHSNFLKIEGREGMDEIEVE